MTMCAEPEVKLLREPFGYLRALGRKPVGPSRKIASRSMNQQNRPHSSGEIVSEPIKRHPTPARAFRVWSNSAISSSWQETTADDKSASCKGQTQQVLRKMERLL